MKMKMRMAAPPVRKMLRKTRTWRRRSPTSTPTPSSRAGCWRPWVPTGCPFTGSMVPWGRGVPLPAAPPQILGASRPEGTTRPRGETWRRDPPSRPPPWRTSPPRWARSPRWSPPTAPRDASQRGPRCHWCWQMGDRDNGGRRSAWLLAFSTLTASKSPRWLHSSARTMISVQWWPRSTWTSSSLGAKRWTRRSDAAHTLTCAIMLLNTDLHGQHLGRAMTSMEFITNLSGMMDGQDFPKEQLKALYSSIRNEKLAWAADDEEEEEEAAAGGSLAPLGRKKSNPFLELPGVTRAVTYRRGWLARKVLAEADGKKTPWGRRGWKPFQAVLKGTLLFFLKPGGRAGGTRRPSEPGPFPAPQEEGGTEAEEPLGVHHALAERASKYTKRPNVFRLQTADWRVFLFQAPTSEEMLSWISRVNLVAALFSSPAFPAAVGSQRRFVRPILPAAPSRSPPEEQLRSHEAWMERVAEELFEHQRNLPNKRGRARDLDEYRLKKEYLLYERRRYETYVQVLETWINTGARDLEGWEAQAGPVVAPTDPPTLTKAHSSPSLVPEPPIAPTIRVKRNISERRTVRKIVPKRNKNLL
ncbi:PH and SEC7 domain-containing protein 4-like isoform X4 [Cuculus canorus]|uniref:PH and SEC7 domain-containing protein 4-like isoform X4 n=1 Tax=Cuculus canorus TaxID=55661 RepID=UPI0023AAC2ED|nr:PH and SEC7 domain-containing protein 4-like isoform X4 [Cuculus canorus]